MKLYLIRRPEDDRIGWDEYLGFVIAALGAQAARGYAAARAADEGRDTWYAVDTTCILLAEHTDHSEGIVLGSFNAG